MWIELVLQVRNFSELKGLEMTTQHVEKIMKILQREYHRRSNTPICFFHFVIHPDSYSITVENIFYTSFLVRVSSNFITVESHFEPLSSASLMVNHSLSAVLSAWISLYLVVMCFTNGFYTSKWGHFDGNYTIAERDRWSWKLNSKLSMSGHP